MKIKINLPVPVISSINVDNKEFSSKGGKCTFNIKGKNFYADILLSVFDNKGNQIDKEWANVISKKVDKTIITSRKSTITFPKNTTKKDMKYTVKASFDGGKTYNKTTYDITVKTSYKATNNSKSESTNNLKTKKSTSSANTNDINSISSWIITFVISVFGLFGLLFLLKKRV